MFPRQVPVNREAFAKIKGVVRQAGARTKDALVEALDEALSVLGARDAQGYFEHADYRRPTTVKRAVRLDSGLIHLSNTAAVSSWIDERYEEGIEAQGHGHNRRRHLDYPLKCAYRDYP
jgi:hypothetical protein